MFATFTSGKTPVICMTQTSLYESSQYIPRLSGCRSCMKSILLTQSTHTNSLNLATLQPSDAVDICALCAVVMRGWRLYPRALWIIRWSGNKKMHSDYLRVGRRWIR